MDFLRKLFMGNQSQPENSMKDELKAEPISRDRMRLLWMDRTALELLKSGLGQDTIVILDGQGGSSQPQVLPVDIEWAEKVDVIAEKASAAAQQQDYEQAIRSYRDALKLAPGCDLYLMSIGACYSNMGQHQVAVKYLERAAQISPGNDRIQKNLAGVRRLL